MSRLTTVWNVANVYTDTTSVVTRFSDYDKSTGIQTTHYRSSADKPVNLLQTMTTQLRDFKGSAGAKNKFTAMHPNIVLVDGVETRRGEVMVRLEVTYTQECDKATREAALYNLSNMLNDHPHFFTDSLEEG